MNWLIILYFQYLYSSGSQILSVLENRQFDAVHSLLFDNKTTTIGWISLLTCDEGYDHDNFFYDISYEDILDIAPYAISVAIMPWNGTFDDVEEYGVIAKPCSNPIWSLNNLKEVSYTIDYATGKISGFSNLSNWIGSDNAKSRLYSDCFGWPQHNLFIGGDARDFPDFIYGSCNSNGNHGMTITPSSQICLFNSTALEYQHMHVFLGFDANKIQYCNSSIYVEQLTNIVTNSSTLQNNEPKCGDNNENVLDYIQFDNIQTNHMSTEFQYDLGWIQLLSCNPTTNEFIIRDEFTMNDIEQLLPYIVSLKITPISNIDIDIYNKYAVETNPCSNPIFAINNQKEMTWKLNQFNFKILHNYTFENDWIGSNEAKRRLELGVCRYYLDLDYARDFPVIYSNCQDGINIDMLSGICQWNINTNETMTYTDNIEIHFAFDKNKENKCKYELDDFNVTYSDHYILVHREMNAVDAEMFCEQKFGTTLAFINNDYQVQEALNLRHTLQLEGIDLWIGLTKFSGYDYHGWHWYGSDSGLHWCNYTVFGYDCMYDTRWYSMWPILLESVTSQSRCATIWGYGNNIDAYVSHNCYNEYFAFLCDRNNKAEIVVDFDVCTFKETNELIIENAPIYKTNITIGSNNQISFEIKLNNGFRCVEKRCSILHIGDDHKTRLPAVFIRGNDLEIFFEDRNHFYSHSDIIPNAMNILCDGSYHQIDLLFTNRVRNYKIDRISYVFNEANFDFLLYLNNSYPLYIGSIWAESQVNGQIKNLCIQTKYFQVDAFDQYFYPFLRRKPHKDNFDFFSKAIGYWNENLFAYSYSNTMGFSMYYSKYGMTSITQTQYDPFNIPSKEFDIINIYAWKKNMADHFVMLSYVRTNMPITTQYKDQLFFLYPSADPWYTCLWDFNLTSKSIQTFSIIPPENFSVTFLGDIYPCLAASEKYVYIFYNGTIIYDRQNNLFSVSSATEFQLLSTGCVINNNESSIFIFGGLNGNNGEPSDAVYKYDIRSDSIVMLLDVKLSQPAMLIKVVAAANNKAYLIGGIVTNFRTMRPWETIQGANGQIFDMVTKQFGKGRIIDDNLFLKIDAIHYEYWIDTVYDHNHHLLLKIDGVDTFEYFIIDPVAIDFSITDDSSWRSFIFIDYIINDYTPYLGVYKFVMQYLNSTNTIQYMMMINAIDNICYLCNYNDEEWNVNCQTPCYLSVYDPNVDIINVNITSHSYRDVTILNDKILDIQFLNCTINFKMASLGNNYISISPKPDDICAKNPLNTYVTHISNDITQINHDIIIILEEVDGVSNMLCIVCTSTNINIAIDESCKNCSNAIQLPTSLSIPNGSYIVELFSDTLDLIVLPKQIEMNYNDTSININKTITKLATLEIISIVCGIFIVLCLLCIFTYFYRKRKILEQEIQKQNQFAQTISHPLVCAVGVAFYDDEPENPGIEVALDDLNGIDIDIQNIKLLCNTLNWDLYPKWNECPKTEWTQNQLISLYQKCANITAYGDYDSLLFFHSGHGFKHNVITSDFQGINKDAIQKIFSSTHPRLRTIPRIFVFDCCDGTQERSVGAGDYSASSDTDEHDVNNDYSLNEDLQVDKDIGKNFDTKDVAKLNLDQNLVKDEKGANYKLVTIHAANTGFQSKLDALCGSYLVHEFVGRVIENFEDEKDEFLGNIMQYIQAQLHSKGKQLPISSFNHQTRYLKFAKNDNPIVNNDTDESEITSQTTIDNTTQKNDQHVGTCIEEIRYENDGSHGKCIGNNIDMDQMENVLHQIDED
eukprot:432049_1